MLLKIDFHVHTNASKDGLDDVGNIVCMALKRGLDGIAITDHNTMENVDRAIELGRKCGLLIIRGEEVKTKEGDVLVFGLRKSIPKDLTLERTIQLARKQKALVFAAHPYALIFHSLSSMGNALHHHKLDGVEVFNSRTYIRNWKSLNTALKYGWCMIAGSDAHSASEVGNAYTLVYAGEKSESAVLEALRNSRTSFEGKRTPLHMILKWYFKRVSLIF